MRFIDRGEHQLAAFRQKGVQKFLRRGTLAHVLGAQNKDAPHAPGHIPAKQPVLYLFRQVDHIRHGKAAQIHNALHAVAALQLAGGDHGDRDLLKAVRPDHEPAPDARPRHVDVHLCEHHPLEGGIRARAVAVAGGKVCVVQQVKAHAETAGGFKQNLHLVPPLRT